MSLPLFVHSDLPQYQIEEILGRKNTKNGVMYLIKWRGFQAEESTWEPVINLLDSMDMVRQFERKHHEQQNDLNNNDELHQGENAVDPGRKNKRIFKEHLIFGKHKKFRIKNQIKVLKHEKFPKSSSLQEKLKPSMPEEIEMKNSQNNFRFADQQKKTLNSSSLQKLNPLRSSDFGFEQFCVVVQEMQYKPQLNSNYNQLKKQQKQALSSAIQNDDQSISPFKNSSLESKQFKADTFQNINRQHEKKVEASLIDNIKIFNIPIPHKELKVLKQNDPGLKAGNIQIKGIVSCEGSWYAQIGNEEQVVGYICLNDLKGMKKSDLQFLTKYMELKEKLE